MKKSLFQRSVSHSFVVPSCHFFIRTTEKSINSTGRIVAIPTFRYRILLVRVIRLTRLQFLRIA